jgi:hypothetical protein
MTAHPPLNTSRYFSWSSFTVHLAKKSPEIWTQYRIFSSPSKMTLLSLMTLPWHVCRVSVHHALKLDVLLVLPKFLNVLLFYFCNLIHLFQHRTYMSTQPRNTTSIYWPDTTFIVRIPVPRPIRHVMFLCVVTMEMTKQMMNSRQTPDWLSTARYSSFAMGMTALKLQGRNSVYRNQRFTLQTCMFCKCSVYSHVWVQFYWRYCCLVAQLVCSLWGLVSWTTIKIRLGLRSAFLCLGRALVVSSLDGKTGLLLSVSGAMDRTGSRATAPADHREKINACRHKQYHLNKTGHAAQTCLRKQHWLENWLPVPQEKICMQHNQGKSVDIKPPGLNLLSLGKGLRPLLRSDFCGTLLQGRTPS